MFCSRHRDNVVAGSSKTTSKSSQPDKHSSFSPKSSSAPSNKYDDDDDDFNPRSISNAKPSVGTTDQVNLFEQSLVGDVMVAPAPVSTVKSTMKSEQSEVDLFADSSFLSTTSLPEGGRSSGQSNVDLFASQPSPPAVLSTTNVNLFASLSTPSSAVSSNIADSSNIDFFALPDPVSQPDDKSSNTESMTSSTFDPFAAVSVNNFHGTDPFAAFTSHTEPVSKVPSQNAPNISSTCNLDGSLVETRSPTKKDDETMSPVKNDSETKSPAKTDNGTKSPAKKDNDTKSPGKKDNFQVKSGIWADSLSRGLIDLNISGPKKVNLSDIGIVGGLTDESDARVTGAMPVSFYMGQAIGTGSGLSKSGFSSTAPGGDDFSNLGGQ